MGSAADRLGLARAYLARALRELERGDYELAVEYARAAAHAALYEAYRALGVRPSGFSVSELLEGLGAPPELRARASLLDGPPPELCDCAPEALEEEPPGEAEAAEAVEAARGVLELCEEVVRGSASARAPHRASAGSGGPHRPAPAARPAPARKPSPPGR